MAASFQNKPLVFSSSPRSISKAHQDGPGFDFIEEFARDYGFKLSIIPDIPSRNLEV